MDGRDHPLFHKLRARLVSPQIYVHCQHLIARKLAENFSFFAGNRTFYTTCSNNDVSRVSLSCFYCASFLVDCGVVMYCKFGCAESSPQKFTLKFTQNAHKSLLGTPHNHPTFHIPLDPDMRIKIPAAMMAKGYSDKESKNRTLQMQVCRVVEKIRGLDPPRPT
jgi:hypothetical protein